MILGRDKYLPGTWNVSNDNDSPCVAPDSFSVIFVGHKGEELAKEYLALKTLFPGDVMKEIAELQKRAGG